MMQMQRPRPNTELYEPLISQDEQKQSIDSTSIELQ